MLDALLKRRAEIDKEFLPSLKAYTEMAQEAVKIQAEIVRHHCHQRGLPVRDYSLVAKISAKLHPQQIEAAFKAVADIKIAYVIYDDVNREFVLYGLPNGK